jgi:hypothetical protein
MTCDILDNFNALDNAYFKRLSRSEDFSSRIELISPMYLLLIETERTYSVPVFDDGGRPKYASDGSFMLGEMETPFGEIAQFLTDKMKDWDTQTVSIILAVLHSSKIELGIEDAICIVCKYFVKIYKDN